MDGRQVPPVLPVAAASSLESTPRVPVKPPGVRSTGEAALCLGREHSRSVFGAQCAHATVYACACCDL